MNKFTALTAAFGLLSLGASIAMATDRPLYACEDGAQTSNPKLCKDHGGVLGSKKAVQPIDTTKGLTPNSTATTSKKKSTSKTASTGTKKKSSYSGSSPTAKCNDGAYYYSRERRGACASHGGVDKWIGF